MGYIVILLITIAIDQLTKAWIVDSFRLYESVEIVPGFFNLVYVTNSGAAFSLLANVDSPWRHYFFLGIGMLAMVGLTVAYIKLRKVNRYYSLALALIAGGAAGNLIDRVRFGAVVDFLDIYVGHYHWPAFNVADSAICIGAGVFLILNIFEVRNQEVRNQ
ncbi:MAG: signal peptidase II [Pseudomonadota bacterium]